MATLVHLDNSAVQMREKLTQYKEESEKVHITSQKFAGVILTIGTPRKTLRWVRFWFIQIRMPTDLF